MDVVLSTSKNFRYDDRFTDLAGNTAWPNPLPSNDGYDLFINDQNIQVEYESKIIHVDSITNPTTCVGGDIIDDGQGNKDIRIVLKNIPKYLERIIGNSYFTTTKSGSPFFFAGESGFLDYFRFLRGEDIRPLLHRSRELGSKGRRNFWMTYNTGITGGIGPCDPVSFPEFYNRLPEFLNLYADYEQYCYPSIFPDNGYFGYNDQRRIDHLNRIHDVTYGITNLYAEEWTNEIDAHSYNDINRDVLPVPTDDRLFCTGSMGPTGSDPMSGRQGTICDFHQPRQYPNSIVDSCVANHPSRLQQGRRILLGEPLGFGSKALNPNREEDPRVAAEMAGTAIGTAIGIIFHSQHGAFSQAYDIIENACAEVWFDTINGVI